MGIALDDEQCPISKGNNGILALTDPQVQLRTPQPCIRCGRCVQACPIGLSPVEIGDAYERLDLSALGMLWARNCIACGSCSYVCPAWRPVSPTAVEARDYCIKEAKQNAGEK